MSKAKKIDGPLSQTSANSLHNPVCTKGQILVMNVPPSKYTEAKYTGTPKLYRSEYTKLLMSVLDLLNEWTIVQGQTRSEVTLKALANLGLPAEKLVFGKVTTVYTYQNGCVGNITIQISKKTSRHCPSTCNKPKRSTPGRNTDLI